MKQLKVYVTGPVLGRNTDQLNEFALVREKLQKAGFSVTTAADDLPVGDQHDNVDAKENWMAKCLANLEVAEVVLHLDQYEYDDISTAEVKHAKRKGTVRVMKASEFIEKYSKAATAV